MLGIPRTTFYRWYDRYIALGEGGLEDQPSRPGRVWNRIPDAVRRQIVDLALEEPELSPRELAVRFTDTQRYFVSEASVYRLLVAHDLVTSPAFAIIKAADEFHEKTTVTSIGVRSCRIETIDGNTLTIPNGSLSGSAITKVQPHDAVHPGMLPE